MGLNLVSSNTFENAQKLQPRQNETMQYKVANRKKVTNPNKSYHKFARGEREEEMR